MQLLGTFTESERETLQKVLGVTPQLIPLPNPIFPGTLPGLTPASVRASRAQRQNSKRWNRLIGQVLWIYLLVVAGLLGQLGWLNHQANILRQQIQEQTPMVQKLNQISDRWNSLQPAIDPTNYPLETLLACVTQLPTEARLTKFEHSPGKALLMGETRDAANAVKFLNNLKSEETLKKWTWTMPQPQLLPSNQAQFQLEGSHALAPVQ